MRPLVAGLMALASAAAPAGLTAQRTTDVAVDGVVCDAGGRPVAGARFADRWEVAGGRWQGTLCCNHPERNAPLRSDAEGRLRGLWVEDPMGTPLFGIAADRSLVGFVSPEYVAEGATYRAVVRGRIVLQRPTLLRGAARTSLGSQTRGPISVGLTLPHPCEPGQHRGFWLRSESLAFELPLPPATYALHVRAGHGTATRTVVLPAERETVDIGALSVPLKAFDLVGEVLPDWALRGAENLSLEEAALPALRGKPLLVRFDEFGERWRPAGDVRAQLARLAEHPRRGEFRVVLFDTSFPRPPPFAQQPGEPVVERMFPRLAPAEGFDVDAVYGTRWATIVLDRDGRLLHCGTDVPGAIAALEAALPTVDPPRK